MGRIMRKIVALLLTGVFFIMCSNNNNTQTNPFYTTWDTPFQTAPFNLIQEAHYMPAFEQGIKEQKETIAKITANQEAATFKNTIVALEMSDPLLVKVASVFFNLESADNTPGIQEISKKVTPLLTALSDDIYLNADLFKRVKAVYEQKDALGLNKEQQQLLDKTYKRFARGGANLNEADKATLRKINEELSLLGLQYSEQILKENNRFELVISKKDELIGLPKGVVEAAAEAAKERGHEGKWAFTLHKPSLIPFLQYSQMRAYRKKMFLGYTSRGNHNDELDTKKIIVKMANLRIKKANLLGYKTHADFILEENMAKNANNVMELLDKLWSPALKVAKQERAMMQAIIDKEGGKFKLQAWDWWFYAEKIRKEKYDLDESEIRPYLQVENVIKGAFVLAEKLFGITFTERNDIAKYHPEVKTYEVKDADGSHIGIYYTDYFYRASKRSGAWMNEYRSQSNVEGEFVTPIIVNVGNFTKPTKETPSLLSLDEAHTLFHEFGHALHGLLSQCTYPSLAGTSTPRDFVEFPSQVMENWVLEPEMLKLYAFHYQTGEVMPQKLIDKIKAAALFNKGFETVEYLAASYLDMHWHTLQEPLTQPAMEFEEQVLGELGLIPEIVSRYRSTFFGHIFSGPVGYSSGYYSYIWSEVLDADAYQAFKETELFSKDTAAKYRKFILSSGGTDDPMELYRKYRGRDPKIEPLLNRRGFN